MSTRNDFVSMVFEYYFSSTSSENSIIEEYLKDNNLYSINNLNYIISFIKNNNFTDILNSDEKVINKLYRNAKLKHIINNDN